jgi:hypothetical protein
MFSKKLSSRYNLLVKLAGILAPLGELAHLSGFADEAAKLSGLGRAKMLGEGVEVGTSMLGRSDDLISLIKKDPTEFAKTFEGLNPSQKMALREVWSKIPSATKEGKTIEEFAVSAAKTSEKLKSNALSIEKFVKSKPSEFLERYAKEPEFKKAIDRIWKSHPEGSKLGAVEDFAKAELSKGTAAVPEAAGGLKGAMESIDDSLAIFSKGDETAAIKEYEKLRGLARGEGTPVTPEEMKKIFDAIDSNNSLTPQAAGSLKESIRKITITTEAVPTAASEAARVAPEAAVGAKAISSRVTETVIKETDDATAIAKKLEVKTVPATPEEVAHIAEVAKTSDGAADLLKLENEETMRRALATDDLAPIADDMADAIRRDPDAVANSLREAAETSTPAAKGVNLRRAAKIAGAIALGLGGIALINYLWGGDDEAKEEAKAEIESSGGGSGGGGEGSPEAGRLDYEGASKIMMDKGYLGSIQNDWTPEFGAAFREFIDAGTANNSAVTPTNLVGGQKWVDVAPGLGFSPDRGGALNAIVAIGKSAPSKRGGPNSPPITGGGRVPEDTGGGRGAKSAKREVLADIISRLYNNRLVEGGGGIFSNELKQTQSLVDAIGGAGPGGYLNAADVLLARNPQLESMLPSTKITDVLTRKNIESHPAYQAALNTQKTIHDVFKAANRGKRILGINRGQNATTKNVAEYLASPAGGNWKQPTTASNSVDRFVKLAEDRKARIKTEVLSSLTPAERAIVRKNKMRGA